MKKILLTILGVLAVIILGLVLFAPTTVKVEASQTVEASKQRVFEEVLSFKARDAWNPWSELDPNMDTEITGTDGKVGAKYAWSGNSDVGKGEQEITAIQGMDRIDTKLTFTEPWASEADTYITLDKVDGGTKVSWGFTSEAPRPMNAMMLFMKGAIEADYIKGLKKLDELIDNKPYTWEIKEIDMPASFFVGKRSKLSIADITKYYTEVFPAVFGFITQKGIAPIGMPQGLTYGYSEESSGIDLAAVIRVADASEVGDAFEIFSVPAGRAVQLDYYGPYDQIEKGHEELDFYFEKNKLSKKNPVAEEYVTDPTTVDDPSKVLSRITFWIE